MKGRWVPVEFWNSDDLGNVSPFARLLFIGLWAYVDDNGVQFDRPTSIAAQVFPVDFEKSPEKTLEQVKQALDELWCYGHIIRYTLPGFDLLQITPWGTGLWQKPNHPSKARFNTSDDERAVVKIAPKQVF